MGVGGTNNSNIPNTVYPVTSISPNPRPSQRTFNSNRQRRNRRNRYDNPDYDPDEEHDLDNYMWYGDGASGDCSDQERYNNGKIE
ncbi:hypothetical protein F8M41_003587 [Gigaspora margarita]|uniref:Uncharacterized protein n=1 Tax=Gigaspora margarita TaxID=4874 RepID=A0A8H3XBV1_GIGMA|nr:hypothetical protein F8M41_003587 [Gigaspora margarita]